MSAPKAMVPLEYTLERHRPGITITRGQLEDWAGRRLTDDEVERLDECIPNSSIPEAIETIVGSFASEE